MATSDNSSNSRNTSRSNDNYDSMSVKNLRQMLALRGFDCSRCLEKRELIAAAREFDHADFDEEALKIFRQLNLSPGHAATDKKSRYSSLDAIWKHPDNEGTGDIGGTVYVGNYQAASNKQTLRDRGIVAIVNCQDATSKNYFEDDPSFKYYRFLVSKLAYTSTRGYTNTEKLALWKGGFRDVFQFIQNHIQVGHSVLIHCLAGAHRAGTTGTAWLMFKTGKNVHDSLQLATACRGIINPFGILLEALHKLEHELQEIASETPTE